MTYCDIIKQEIKPSYTLKETSKITGRTIVTLRRYAVADYIQTMYRATKNSPYEVPYEEVKKLMTPIKKEF